MPVPVYTITLSVWLRRLLIWSVRNRFGCNPACSLRIRGSTALQSRSKINMQSTLNEFEGNASLVAVRMQSSKGTCEDLNDSNWSELCFVGVLPLGAAECFLAFCRQCCSHYKRLPLRTYPNFLHVISMYVVIVWTRYSVDRRTEMTKL